MDVGSHAPNVPIGILRHWADSPSSRLTIHQARIIALLSRNRRNSSATSFQSKRLSLSLRIFHPLRKSHDQMRRWSFRSFLALAPPKFQTRTQTHHYLFSRQCGEYRPPTTQCSRNVLSAQCQHINGGV